MNMSEYILALDQGTTSTRAVLFDSRGKYVTASSTPITQHYPKPGWVEHDPVEIWRSTLKCVESVLRKRRVRIAGIGITNQRETTILWDRKTGRPLHRAIVWQDRRTAPDCARLRRAGMEKAVRGRTGLVLDPYFSGTKLAWLLRNVPGARAKARAGRLAFGTVDSWLIWNLTGGKVHATDPSNASRTMLLNLRTKNWDPAQLKMLGIPAGILPKVLPSAGKFGVTVRLGSLPSGIPVSGVAGDQQSALFGQGCVKPGEMKVTYGTGGFLLVQTGKKLVRSRNGLLTTLACGERGEATYALEGSVFIAGAVMQWLRDGLKIIASSPESEKWARSVPDTGGVYIVPAFTGLGAPWWDADARGIITGLTRGTGKAQLIRASEEAIAYQTADVVSAMGKDIGRRIRELRVDGGACRDGFLMQFQADILDARIVRPNMVETTAAGAGYLAGLGAGLWSPAQLKGMRATDRIFTPKMKQAQRTALLGGWHRAVARARSTPARVDAPASPAGGLASPLGGLASPLGGPASPLGGPASPLGGPAAPG